MNDDERELHHPLQPLARNHEDQKESLLRSLPAEAPIALSESGEPATSNDRRWWWVAAATVIALVSFRMGRQSNTPNHIVYADVIAAVEKVDSVGYVRGHFVGGERDELIRYRIRGTNFQRLEYVQFPHWDILQQVITDLPNGVGISLDPVQQTAQKFELEGGSAETTPEGMEKHQWSDFYPSLHAIPSNTVSTLPAKTIHGRKAIGFFHEQVDESRLQQTTVWVDEQTLLPIEIETSYPSNPWKMETIVRNDFWYDDPFYPSVFSTEVPPGIQITN